jgi:hypothetical protein
MKILGIWLKERNCSNRPRKNYRDRTGSGKKQPIVDKPLYFNVSLGTSPAMNLLLSLYLSPVTNQTLPLSPLLPLLLLIKISILTSVSSSSNNSGRPLVPLTANLNL